MFILEIDDVSQSDDCRWTFLNISKKWFKAWLGAVKQQASTRATADPDIAIWRHSATMT